MKTPIFDGEYDTNNRILWKLISSPRAIKNTIRPTIYSAIFSIISKKSKWGYFKKIKTFYNSIFDEEYDKNKKIQK